MNRLLALYGLKWNPFSADIPVAALWTPPKLDHFRWRMEQQVRDGGFALSAGDPGTGKSVALRLLAHHLAADRGEQLWRLYSMNTLGGVLTVAGGLAAWLGARRGSRALRREA